MGYEQSRYREIGPRVRQYIRDRRRCREQAGDVVGDPGALCLSERRTRLMPAALRGPPGA